MNSIQEINRINQRELDLGLTGSASWHHQYSQSAYVHVGGLSYEMTEGDVLAVFSQFGEIMDINMPRDQDSGKPRGFAFLMYEDQRSTVLAVDNMNGALVLGRMLKVDHVHKYEQPGKRDEEGKYQKPEEPTYNAMPPELSGSDDSSGSESDDDPNFDVNDPMAAFLRDEKRKLKSSKKSGGKEEKRRRKEERRKKREERERRRLIKALKSKEKGQRVKVERGDEEGDAGSGGRDRDGDERGEGKRGSGGSRSPKRERVSPEPKAGSGLPRSVRDGRDERGGGYRAAGGSGRDERGGREGDERMGNGSDGRDGSMYDRNGTSGRRRRDGKDDIRDKGYSDMSRRPPGGGEREREREREREKSPIRSSGRERQEHERFYGGRSDEYDRRDRR